MTKYTTNNPILDIRDDRLLAVVNTDAQLEIVADGFEFLEGPIWHPYDHHMIFSDIIGDTMYRWQQDEGVHLFRQPASPFISWGLAIIWLKMGNSSKNGRISMKWH